MKQTCGYCNWSRQKVLFGRDGSQRYRKPINAFYNFRNYVINLCQLTNQNSLLERQALLTSKPDSDSVEAQQYAYPPSGFAGLTRRTGRKPVIAACNGHAHGGGFEIVLNSDIVIASPNADFRLPDVLRGTAAMMGAFPRLCRTFGLQRAMWIALTAHTLTAQDALDWGLVQKIVPIESLVKEALSVAGLIANMSPDSVIVSRAGVRQAWETSSVEHATSLNSDAYAAKLMSGQNAKEGMLAFKEKRAPKWVPSKL